MTRILFLHNTVMPYRIPFFLQVGERFKVKFVFTDLQLSSCVYGRDVAHDIEEINLLEYKVLNSRFRILQMFRELYLADFTVVIVPLDRYGLITYLIAKLRNKKVIMWSEEWDWKKKGLTRILRTMLYRHITTHIDAILVPGVKHRDYYISLGTPSEKIFIVPNVSNVSQKDGDLQNLEMMQRKLNVKDQKVVLYVGRLRKQKGVDYLIHAFSMLRNEVDNVVLIIIGNGECMGELTTLSKKLNVNHHTLFLGYIENSKLGTYYNMCDVLVMPSITYEQADAWGFVINEAMYFSKPVIASDAVGASFDMIENGKNGYIVPERNSEAIYQALKDILGDPSVERKMGHCSKRIVDERFRYSNMVEGFAAAIEYVRGSN